MITLNNPSEKTFSVQYVKDFQVFKKEILPHSITAFKHLTTLFQIKNLQSLTGNSIGVYDSTSSTYINQGSFRTGYKGVTVQSGMTIYTPLVTVPTGWTFVTSAATAGVALNSATASTVGNTVNISYSGAAVTTSTWLNAVNTTAFSGLGFSIFGASAYVLISSGATTSFSVSANTISSNATDAYFIGDDVKREQYNTFNAFDLNSTYLSLSALTYA